jgi:hypothetical protein
VSELKLVVLDDFKSAPFKARALSDSR